MGFEGVTQAVALQWFGESRRIVLALLVEVIGSAPLEPGAVMLIDDLGNIEGSVTGGCVEGALVEEAGRVLAGGGPRVVTYGISDEISGQVGLTCGGTVRVLVAELIDGAMLAYAAALTAAREGRPAAIAVLLDGATAGRMLAVVDGDVIGGMGLTDLLDHSVTRDANGLLQQGISTVRCYGNDGSTMESDLRVFIQSFTSPPRMVIFGASDFSAALALLAHELGYRVTICDARKPFLDSDRFTRAAEIVNDWPDRYLADKQYGERDAILVFTHDTKFDEPALLSALDTGAGYIGALGSRSTQRDRMGRLAKSGVSKEQLDRIVGPCGLDIGAGTPMESAISILAEIISRRADRSGMPLSAGNGAIRPENKAFVSR